MASLLDTGCERNICPLRLCKNAIISPVKAELFAANGSPIRIVGATRLFFEIQGMPLHADVFVTEEIDEMIFGYEFLVQNNCIWTFGQRQIMINGQPVPLHNRQSKTSVRRIYVREPIVIPSDTSVNVPVRMPFVNLHTVESDWITESKPVRPGLLAARTLLSHDDNHAAISFVNVSGVDQSLRQGFALGVATSCPPDLVRPFMDARHGLAMQSAGEDIDTPTAETVDGGRDVHESVSDESDTQVKCASIHNSSEMPPTAITPRSK